MTTRAMCVDDMSSETVIMAIPYTRLLIATQANWKEEGGGVRSGTGAARTILLFHIISASPPKQPLFFFHAA